MSRFRITALCALALAVASAIAVPASAGSAAVRVSPRGFGPPSQIPWGSVGSGWVLTDWATGRPSPHHSVASYLVLTNQAGQRYLVLKESGTLAYADLLDWSGNGRSALFYAETNAGRTTLLVVSLRTGAIEHSFVVPTSSTIDFQSASFTRPNGLAVVVSTYTTHAVLKRYSLSGQSLVTYPSALASVGKLDGSWLYRHDGTVLAIGAAHGLAIVANDGAPTGRLYFANSSYCQPKSWWSATVVLATCAVGVHSESRLFEFSIAGGAPRALTRVNVPPDYGDISGWRVGGHVYVDVASACGYVYLARLVGAAPIMVHVPGVPTGYSILVVGASNSSLALTASIACHGGPSLLWYTPSSNSTRVVLGPPVTGGVIGVSLPYPTRLG